jgi:hypothetical protein
LISGASMPEESLATLSCANEAQQMQLQERDKQIQALQANICDRERILVQQELRLQDEAQESTRLQERLQAQDCIIAELEDRLHQCEQDLSHEKPDQRENDRNEVQRLREENQQLKLNTSCIPAFCGAPALAHSVVIDNHIILAGVTDPSTYPSPALRRTESNPSVGHAQSPSDCPSKNPELLLNAELQSNSDWRGALALSRESKVYTMARTVIERAAEMMDGLDMTHDVADSSWNMTGLGFWVLRFRV